MALVTATAVQVSFYSMAQDLETDEALWELYGRWAAHHPDRFATFKANTLHNN